MRCKLGDISEITKLAGYEFTKYIKYIPDGEIIAVRALNLMPTEQVPNFCFERESPEDM